MTAIRNLINTAQAGTFEKLSFLIYKISTRSPAWGLMWTEMSVYDWVLRRECNSWLKKGISTPKEVLLHNIIHTTTIVFREQKFKKTSWTRGVIEALHIWEAHVHVQLDRAELAMPTP